ncbi:MAG TPA: PQQ-binding-like beta-propeller repeat protein [Opitutaceae bacterium]|nr:PQQ-binding-like beta-propeller repeat protein [Opitutaceae bacterium]
MKTPAPLLACTILFTAIALVANAAETPADTPPAPPPRYSPETLPGKGLAQHPFFYAGEWNYPNPQQAMFIVRDGKIAWSYEIPLKNARGDIQEYSDATLLSNGNILFAYKTGARLITADKKTLWNYDAPKGFEVHIAQPLGLDRAMLIQNGDPAKMMIVRLPGGEVEKEMILPTGKPKSTHGQFRRARLTAAGTLLAAHMDNDKVAEYDMAGKEIWSLAVPAPWAAVRLKNGNTLLTSNKGFVREVNPKGETVWELTQADVPDIKLFSLQEADRLANGNTVISNWCPNGIKDPKNWHTSVQVFEVTPDKKIVWALRAWDEPAALGPATVIQLLDEPGVPEKGEQQR